MKVFKQNCAFIPRRMFKTWTELPLRIKVTQHYCSDPKFFLNITFILYLLFTDL